MTQPEDKQQYLLASAPIGDIFLNSSSLPSWLNLWQPASSERERLELNPKARNAVQNGSLRGPSRKVYPRWAREGKHTHTYFNTWRSLTKTRWPAHTHTHTQRGFIWAGIYCGLENRRNWAWAPKDLQPKHRHARLEMRAWTDSAQLIQNIVTRQKTSTHTFS